MREIRKKTDFSQEISPLSKFLETKKDARGSILFQSNR